MFRAGRIAGVRKRERPARIFGLPVTKQPRIRLIQMKTYIVIAVVAVSVLGAVAFAAGVKCQSCKGTGWSGGNGQFKCAVCGGDGVFGN